MPTISAGDFRKGMIFEMEGKPMLVVDFQHVKPGKGAAFVRTKYKNVITGAIREESFNPTAKFEQASVERKDAEYSYNDGDLYYFMDPETYDMSPLNRDVLGEAFKFMKENTVCKLVSYKGSVFTVEVPNFMDLEVTETEPGVKGDTATNVTKRPPWRPARSSRCPCSSTRARRFRWTPAPASTWAAARSKAAQRGDVVPPLDSPLPAGGPANPPDAAGCVRDAHGVSSMVSISASGGTTGDRRRPGPSLSGGEIGSF